MNTTKKVATVIVLGIVAFGAVGSLFDDGVPYHWTDRQRQDCIDHLEPRLRATNQSGTIAMAMRGCAAEEAIEMERAADAHRRMR
jgi:hypothetical protein